MNKEPEENRKEELAVKEDKVQEAREERHTHTPSCDVIDSPDEIRIVMDMPGISPEDVDVDVHDRVLKVCACSSHVCRKHGCISYCRSFQLSEDIDCGNISAKVCCGILELKLPKIKSARVHKIKVNQG